MQCMRKSSILLFGGMMQSTGNLLCFSFSLPTLTLPYRGRQHSSGFDPVTHKRFVLGQKKLSFSQHQSLSLQDVDRNSSMSMILHTGRSNMSNSIWKQTSEEVMLKAGLSKLLLLLILLLQWHELTHPQNMSCKLWSQHSLNTDNVVC